MICVCTTCVHLACAELARKTAHWSDSSRIHRYDIKLRSQGQQRLPLEPPAAQVAEQAAASNLDYRKQIETELVNNIQSYEINQIHRNKRHAGHSHEAAAASQPNHIEVNRNAGHFIEKLFAQFSNGDSKTMNLIEFEKLMKHLGLVRLIDDTQLNNLIHPSDDERSSHSDRNIGSTHGIDNHGINSPDTHSNDTVSKIRLRRKHVYK